MEMIRHYHIAHQYKTKLPTIEPQFLQKNLGESLIPKEGVMFIGVRSDEMCI